MSLGRYLTGRSSSRRVAGVVLAVAAAGRGSQRGPGSLDALAPDGTGGIVEAPVGGGFRAGLVGFGEEVELCVHEFKYGAGV